MKIVKADILSNLDKDAPTVIIHGCNCFHTMGAGIAKYLKQQFPSIYQVDRCTNYGDRRKLGSYSVAHVGENLVVLNCYTQYHYKNDHRGQAPVDYDAIERCLSAININYKGWSIRSPKIGCGLAGGDWVIVSDLFKKCLTSCEYTIYEI